MESKNRDKTKTRSVKIAVNKKLFEINYKELRYLRIIGEGGSSTVVYLVSYRDQYYAYKRFKEGLFDENAMFDEFEKEVSLLSSLRHPNIIGFYGASVAPPKNIGILLEYCKHGDVQHYVLHRRMEGKSLKIDEKYRLCREIAMGMNYLHLSGVIHRDLKLKNVLISDVKSAKVMDFGLSKFSDNDGSKTQTRQVGTSVFMSPEVQWGKYSKKIDVYSYAILVYLIITEKTTPYDRGLDESEAMYKAAMDPSFRPKIEKEKFVGVEFLIDFLGRNWSHDAKDRDDFATIVKFLENQENVSSDLRKSSKNEKHVDKGNLIEDLEKEIEEQQAIKEERLAASRKHLKKIVELKKAIEKEKGRNETLSRASKSN